MKQVYILADSSKGSGLGHIKRCEYLQEFFIQKHVDSFFASIDFNNLDVEKLSQTNNSIILIDSHQNISNIVEIFKRNDNIVIVLDNFINDQRDLSINIFNHSQTIGNKVFSGYQHVIIRQAVLDQKLSPYTPEAYALVSLGGEDINNQGLQMAKEIKKYFSKTVLVQGPLAKELNTIDEIIITKNPDNFVDLIKKSQIVFCNAGSTLFESVLLKKPCISIPQTKYEGNISQDFLSRGYILNIGLQNLKESVRKLNVFSMPELCFEGKGAAEIYKCTKEYI